MSHYLIVRPGMKTGYVVRKRLLRASSFRELIEQMLLETLVSVVFTWVILAKLG